jgi:dienelactone hydrolase
MFRKLLKFNLVLIAVLLCGFVVLKSIGDARYFADYDPALPHAVEVVAVENVDKEEDLFGVVRRQEFRKTTFSFEARPGDRVPCVLAQPLEIEGRLPTIIFVHGAGQKKNFVEDICTPFVKAGFNMVSFDQWNCGERKVPKEERFKYLTAYYSRGWKAVNDTRRLADYLVTRDDVDPDRLYLVGASYGAMTSTHILAQDKRFKAGVLVVGGGNFKVMLDAPLIRNEVPGIVLSALKPLANWLGKPFDPINSAPHTAPTPVLMQCGEDDTLVTPEAGKELYARMAEPKELVWYDIDHPGLRDGDGEEIVRMLDDGLVWLAKKAGVTIPAATTVTAANFPQPAE